MTANPNPNRKWIPVYQAFDGLRRQYIAAEAYYDDEACWRAANDTLLRRLRSGQLNSRSAHYEYHVDLFGSDPEEPPKPDPDGMIPVPRSWWFSFLQCDVMKREADWLAGDFDFEISGTSYNDCSGSAYGVEIDQSQVASFIPAISNPLVSEGPNSGSRKGRAPANWWPGFAEELAVYIHEEGFPPGSGREGQSTVIEAVFQRLAAAGRTEPGRATVQPVINAVLDRICSAGK